MFYTEIITTLKKHTDKVILFHSGTGKDSIMLCDVLSKNFSQVLCVFMYIVPGLEYEHRYITWAQNKYKNILFYKTPHFILNSFIKHGYLGIKKNEATHKATISSIDNLVKQKYGTEWSVYGFKKNDGITRRLMLNGYKDGLFYKTKKAYPLMDMTNHNVLSYVSDNDLITPFNYGTNKPSSGCDVSNPFFLSYLRKRYPDDLKKIYIQFPMCEAILFKHDNYGIKAE